MTTPTTTSRALRAARFANGHANLWQAIANEALNQHHYDRAQLLTEAANVKAREAGALLGHAYRVAGLLALLAALGTGCAPTACTRPDGSAVSCALAADDGGPR